MRSVASTGQPPQPGKQAAGAAAPVAAATVQSARAPPAQVGQLDRPPPPPAENQGSTSVNIAIQDSKDFPLEVAPMEELYSEFTMLDGRVLFECPGLVKATGIDLMNCPLDVVLKLRVVRRMPQGHPNAVLWHVVLPLPQMSKYLLNPPHEWETWIGLMPNTQDLDAFPPETLFTQSVHLISRPEFPKLRLRFTYTNPEWQAQLMAQRELQQQESRRRVELTQKVGRAQFEEISKLTRSFRDTGQGGNLESSNSIGSTGSTVPAVDAFGPPGAQAPKCKQGHKLIFLGKNCNDGWSCNGQHEPGGCRSGITGFNQTKDMDRHRCSKCDYDLCQRCVDMQMPSEQEERLNEALLACVQFMAGIHQMLEAQFPTPGAAGPPVQLPPCPTSEEIVSSASPASAVDEHCRQLLQCLRSQTQASASCGRHEAGGESTNFPNVEPLLSEGLRMALMGMLGDSDGKIPRTQTHLSDTTSDKLTSIQTQFPGLWDAYREVSALAMERATLLDEVSNIAQERTQLREQQRHLQDNNYVLQQELVSLRSAAGSLQQGEAKRQFEKLLAQQRQALQLAAEEAQHKYEQDLVSLRQQLEDARRAVGEREAEIGDLRAQLDRFRHASTS